MLNYILYCLGKILALILPLKLAYKIAIIISDIRYIFAHKDKVYVENNLKAIFPEKKPEEIKRIRKEVFRNFAKYLVDFFRISKVNQKYIKKYVYFKNFNYLNESFAKNKGIILLTAHIGNWELGGAILSYLGYPIWAVALPHKNKKVDIFFNHQRELKRLKVIPLGRAIIGCTKVLRNKEIVALLGDRDFSQRGIIVDFLNKKVRLPIGPALFALKTGAIILPGFLIRNSDDTFTLYFEKPLEFSDYTYEEENIREVIQNYKTIIEDYIRKYPEQWYMFVPFWINNK